MVLHEKVGSCGEVCSISTKSEQQMGYWRKSDWTKVQLYARCFFSLVIDRLTDEVRSEHR